MMVIIHVLAAIVGLVIGSFLNVCIYRVPLSRLDHWFSEDEEGGKEILTKLRKDLTIFSPARSFCPHCQHQLIWYENIPVLSWLYLRGRCSKCGTAISVRYPAVEILTAIMALLCVGILGLNLTSIAAFILSCTLIVIAFIDYDYFVIPDVISIPATAIGILVALLNHFFNILSEPFTLGLYDSILGLLIGAGFLYVIRYLYYLIRRREGLGLGDVKLLGMLGVICGAECVLFVIFIGSMLGAFIGLLMIAFSGKKLTHAIPFGPYLVIAALLYILNVQRLIIPYLNSMSGM